MVINTIVESWLICSVHVNVWNSLPNTDVYADSLNWLKAWMHEKV